MSPEKDSSLERRTDYNSDVWEEADPEIPGLKQAKGKHAKLLQRADFDRFCRAGIPNYCYQAIKLKTPLC